MGMTGVFSGLRALPVLAAALVLSSAHAKADANSDLIERGKYLTTLGGCTECHTKPGGEPFAGGLPLQTPFGVIPTPNITPDRETGIGTWSDDDFYRSLHNGIRKDGAYIYPAMPFTSYTKVTRDDVLAIKAYLFSIKPVHAPNQPTMLPFPFNIRESLLAWRLLFFKEGEFKPDQTKSAQINRGAYLVEGLEHCDMCHTRRNILGGSENSYALQGGEVQGWYAPNITSDWSRGIGNWSDDELFSYLRTGADPKRGVAAGPMAEVVHENLRNISEEDVRAIIAYLKSTTPKAEITASPPGNFDLGVSGAALYLTHCSQCHQLDGEGVAGKIPALAKNGAVVAAGPENIIKAVLAGLGATQTYGPMPSFAAALDDKQIAAIANYVRNSWGNKAQADADDTLVASIRDQTSIMLAGGEGPSQCPLILTDGAKAVFDKANAEVRDQLQSARGDTLVERVQSIVPKIQAEVQNTTPADIVNGLTAAFCLDVAERSQLSRLQKRSLLDNFAQLTYTKASGGVIEARPAMPAKKAGP
jgi:mono/diheme cytochrome c family protein